MLAEAGFGCEIKSSSSHPGSLFSTAAIPLWCLCQRADGGRQRHLRERTHLFHFTEQGQVSSASQLTSSWILLSANKLTAWVSVSRAKCFSDQKCLKLIWTVSFQKWAPIKVKHFKGLLHLNYKYVPSAWTASYQSVIVKTADSLFCGFSTDCALFLDTDLTVEFFSHASGRAQGMALKYLNNYGMDCIESSCRHSRSPEHEFSGFADPLMLPLVSPAG